MTFQEIKKAVKAGDARENYVIVGNILEVKEVYQSTSKKGASFHCQSIKVAEENDTTETLWVVLWNRPIIKPQAVGASISIQPGKRVFKGIEVLCGVQGNLQHYNNASGQERLSIKMNIQAQALVKINGGVLGEELSLPENAQAAPQNTAAIPNPSEFGEILRLLKEIHSYLGIGERPLTSST